MGSRRTFLQPGRWRKQVYRICLAVSLQRSMTLTRALHLRTGRALAATSGSGQGTHFQEPSFSDLRLVSREY
eukprot:SM002960S10826  [mRNA]  locus=s2960:901:1116:+ [translate_table: standard]